MDFKIELTHLKEEVFKELRDLDSKFTNMFFKKSSEIEEKNEVSIKKINSMMDKNTEMFNSINSQKLKLEKIVELETFKNKTSDMILSQEIRIKELIKDINDIKFKYDREITQNLYLPGYIGPSCQFKSISEYILFNINEVSKIRNDKELVKKENKEIKVKFDSIMKNMFNLVNNSVTRCNEYTESKHKNLELILNTKLEEFKERNMEMRTQIFASQSKVEEEISKMLKLSEELIREKNEIGIMINSKFEGINKSIADINIKISKLTDKYKNVENLNYSLKKSGILNNNRVNFKPMNHKVQSRHAYINTNNNNSSTMNENHKNENSNGESKFVRKAYKHSTNIRKNKSVINVTSKSNTIEKSSSSIKKEKEKKIFDTPKKALSNDKNSDDSKYKKKPVYKENNNIKENTSPNIGKISKKLDLYEVNSFEKLTSEIKKKTFQKTNNKITDDKKTTLSDDDLETKKGKEKMNKFFDKITINSSISNQNNEPPKNQKKIEKIYNLKNVSNNKNEISDYKKNLFKMNQPTLANNKNLIQNKFMDSQPGTDIEDNSKTKNTHNNNNNTTNTFKVHKEHLLITQKDSNNSNKHSNNYLSQKVIYNQNKKDDLFQQFLERHNFRLNNSSDYKNKKLLKNYHTGVISNKLYGTSVNGLYNYYDNNNSNNNNNIFSKTIYNYNNQKLLVKEKDHFYLKKKNYNTESNTIKHLNLDTPEKISFKMISLDTAKNNSNSPIIKKKTRNKIEVVAPITDIFQTFQVKKYKSVIKNITDELPTKISPIFGSTGYSFYSRKVEQFKNMNNINKKNHNISEVNLGLAPSKTIKLYT